MGTLVLWQWEALGKGLAGPGRAQDPVWDHGTHRVAWGHGRALCSTELPWVTDVRDPTWPRDNCEVTLLFPSNEPLA